MKKLTVLFMAVVLLISLTGIVPVNAEIPVNNGKGEALSFIGLQKATPSSNVVISTETDDTFGTVYQYVYDGGLTNTNVQFLLNFANTEAAASGSYYYMSFYYRFIDDDTYDMPNSLVRRPNVSNNSGQASLGTPSSEWKKISFTATNTSDIAATANVQMRLIPFITAGTKICVQIANPQCIYYGKVTAEGELAPEQVIEATLSKSEIEAVYLDTLEVYTSEFPEEYFAEVLWETTEIPLIYAETYIPENYDVSCDSDTLPATFTVTSYALNYNVLDGTGGKSEYKIHVDYKKAAASLDANGSPITENYKASLNDTINLTYQFYNYTEDTTNNIVVLCFKDGNTFKDIITWKLPALSGVTDDMITYSVTDESLVGCGVCAYVISPDSMTIIN